MANQTCHYNIAKNYKYGRYLIANKDLDSGDLIFTDTPFAIGPKPDTPPLCLGCYCPVENTVCSQCGWPICSEECELSSHHAGECEVFSSAKVRFQPIEDWTASSPQLDCITPLRVLLAKEKDPERWTNELEPMETHTEARQNRPTWHADQVNIADFLVIHCKLGHRFDKVLVQRVCGILEVNSIEVPSRAGFSVRAIYPKLAIAAHSCVPNIVHTILQSNNYQRLSIAPRWVAMSTLSVLLTRLTTNNFYTCDIDSLQKRNKLLTYCDTAARIQVYAAVPIKTGESLHICYTYALSPTIIRRDYLAESKFFSCDCPRCSDPTELGTHLSTLKCSKCDNGVLLPTNPLDNEAIWKCTEKNCEFKTSNAAMRKLLGVVQAEIEQLDALEPGPQTIEQREATLKKVTQKCFDYKQISPARYCFSINKAKPSRLRDSTKEEKLEETLLHPQYKSVFHPRHSLLLSIKHTLAQLYGRVEGYSIDELPDVMLERKTEFCRLVLKTLDVITPGESRMRGMMLYELHAPLMFLAKSEYAAGVIDQSRLKERLEEPIQCLSDAARILMREDPQSPEGITGLIAKQSMEQLKASVEAL